MNDLILTCACGHRMAVSSFQVGMTGRCRKCGEPVAISASNTAPRAQAELKAQAASPAEDVCPRCRKTYRGDWDRIQAASGVICYICSNQAVGGVPERLQTPSTADDSARPAPVAVPDEPPRKAFLGIDTDSQMFKGALLAMAVATVVLTIVIVSSGGLYVPPSTPGAGESSIAEADQPPWLGYVYWGWQLFAVYVGAFAAIYLALREVGKLPHDEFWKDAVIIGATLGAITVLQLLVFGLIAFLQDIFVAGIIWTMLVTPLAVFAEIWILVRILDIGVGDFFRMVVYSIPVGFMLSALGLVVASMLAAFVG